MQRGFERSAQLKLFLPTPNPFLPRHLLAAADFLSLCASFMSLNNRLKFATTTTTTTTTTATTTTTYYYYHSYYYYLLLLPLLATTTYYDYHTYYYYLLLLLLLLLTTTTAGGGSTIGASSCCFRVLASHDAMPSARSSAWLPSTSSTATELGTGPLLQGTAVANIIFVNIDWKRSRHTNPGSSSEAI